MKLKKLSTIRFTTKLFVSVVVLCTIAIAITSVNAIRMTDNGLLKLGKDAMRQIHDSVYNSLLTYDTTLRMKLESDIGIFQKEIRTRGEVYLDSSQTTGLDIAGSLGRMSEHLMVPKMKVGNDYVGTDTSLVDAVNAITGNAVTLFQLVDGKLVRISTTVKDSDGSRATGSFIDSDSPVYRAVVAGKVYKGTALVFNTWYVAEYAPLHDSRGKVIGALFVGQPMISPEIEHYIKITRLNAGYFFIYDREGRIHMHPTLEKGQNLFDVVPELKDHEEGFKEYPFKGDIRTTYVQYIAEWDSYLGLSMGHEDIIQGLDVTMMEHSLLVGLIVIVGAIVLTFFLVRTINRPLEKLADQSIKVGEGDYTIEFVSESDDAIGKLAQSLETMVSNSRKMLQEIASSSEELAASSTQMATLADQLVGNADSTTAITHEVSGHAGEVSDNMNSVSAAMEQSTTNLDMIASASEEMGATIKEIAENSARAREITADAVDKAKSSHAGVKGLGEAAQAIGTVTETITEISEQTNLLALNATIEAARAGEAGRGFAVVANEIKELAKETALATGQIRQAIEEIQGQTDSTVQDIDSISMVIQAVNEVVATIVTAVEEQSITTNEIVNNVSQASHGINEINQNVAESSQMAVTVSERVREVSQSSQEVKASSSELHTSATELSNLSRTLTAVVARFKM